MTTGNIATPGCISLHCEKGSCQATTQTCDGPSRCCPPYGCQPQCLQAQ
jgi:hypothetical protein